MVDRDAIDRQLRRLLLPHLGHTPSRWPQPIYDRVRDLARANHKTELALLADLVGEVPSPWLGELIDAATVPHTSFFRHPEQFEYLRRLLRRVAKRGPRPVSVWCAGCATGEEAYSVAVCAVEVQVPVEILATDVNPRAIQVARAGRYSRRRGGRLPGPASATHWEAPNTIRQAIRFEVASLVGPRATMGRGPFDVILCRNVLIYFPREEVPAILQHLASHLRGSGSLLVSPADTVLPLPECLTRGAAVGFLAVRGQDSPPSSRASWAAPVTIEPTPAPPAPIEVAARLLGAGELAAAETLLTDLLNAEPDHLAGWFLLGEVLLQRGENAQARAAFERIARCTPRSSGGFDAATLVWAAARRAKALAADRG
ncbi:MAG: tetratricopeptide repeat protein [Polyangiaceae bacterium]|nr:tetratricopeptide repeat protein [Polyangiaceae bacterium]